MGRNRVQILIPTYNNVDDIEETLQSIWDQDYDQENIYVSVIDFGSTDGTYEKLLHFSKYHLGIYQKSKVFNRKIIPAVMTKTMLYSYPRGKECFSLILYPGDILYKYYLSRCSEAFTQAPNINVVICEVDKKEGARIIKQSPLFNQDCIIDGCRDMKLYVDRGYRHQVQCMGHKLEEQLYYDCGEKNEQRWWNKCADLNIEKTAAYIKEPLACHKCVEYENELEDILLRWNALIINCKFYKQGFGKAFDEDFERLSKKNLAKYAIWRSYLLSLRGPDFQEDAENCLLISGIINPEIKGEKIYKQMERWLYEKENKYKKELKCYFEQHGMN